MENRSEEIQNAAQNDRYKIQRTEMRDVEDGKKRPNILLIEFPDI